MSDPNRNLWNQQYQTLREALANPADHEKAIGLFLTQHAMVHSARMSESGLFSFEDEVWQGMTESAIRRIPKNGDHSVVWIFWHMTRIEDITMNLLVAGSPQILHQGWYERMKVNARDTGNAAVDVPGGPRPTSDLSRGEGREEARDRGPQKVGMLLRQKGRHAE